MHWNDIKNELLKYFGEQTIVVTAKIGRWNGTVAGGDIGNFKELLQKMLEKQDDFEIYDEAGHLFVETYHHDGRNHYEIKILTNIGLKAYDNFSCYDEKSKFSNYTDRQLHQLFMENNFYVFVFIQKEFQLRTIKLSICCKQDSIINN